jgi:plastocyanin
MLALSSAACGGSGGGCTSDKATALSGPLTMQGRAFNPDCFKVASGSTISVDNKDHVAHTFTVKASNIDLHLLGGRPGACRQPAVGTYEFICFVHPGMRGAIVVTKYHRISRLSFGPSKEGPKPAPRLS